MNSASAFVTLAAMLVLAGCGTQQRRGEANQSEPPSANVTEPAPAALPTVEQPLTRRDLILAATESASDLGTGTNDGERQQRLEGRSFSFRIRLCEGAPSCDRLTFDQEESVLRVAVTPDLNAEDPVAVALGAGRFEAVEGFWVPYPWLLQAACPPEPPFEPPKQQRAFPPATPTVPGPILGLAQFFPPEADRSARREGRAFTVTHRLDAGSTPSPVDLVLRGRLTRLPGAKVINCVAAAPMLPPQCVISVRFDSVRLEQAENGELLAEWSGA